MRVIVVRCAWSCLAAAADWHHHDGCAVLRTGGTFAYGRMLRGSIGLRTDRGRAGIQGAAAYLH